MQYDKKCLEFAEKLAETRPIMYSRKPQQKQSNRGYQSSPLCCSWRVTLSTRPIIVAYV